MISPCPDCSEYYSAIVYIPPRLSPLELLKCWLLQQMIWLLHSFRSTSASLAAAFSSMSVRSQTQSALPARAAAAEEAFNIASKRHDSLHLKAPRDKLAPAIWTATICNFNNSEIFFVAIAASQWTNSRGEFVVQTWPVSSRRRYAYSGFRR